MPWTNCERELDDAAPARPACGITKAQWTVSFEEAPQVAGGAVTLRRTPDPSGRWVVSLADGLSRAATMTPAQRDVSGIAARPGPGGAAPPPAAPT